MRWEETGPDEMPWARLTAMGVIGDSLGVALEVNGVPMHVEAYAVEYVGDHHEQVGAHQWAREMIDAIGQIDDGLGAMHTFERDGRSYAIVAYPYGR
jgi:hypothetical protein